MTIEKLTRSDKRLIAIVILIAAVSVLYTRFNYSAAFPEASIELRYSKAQITQMAEAFLSRQGLSTEGFRNLTLFDPDETARIYLERETGLEEANRLMQGPVTVWRWRARWFRPPDKNERIVLLRPTGELAGFEHVIPEEAPGARLDRNQARLLAEAFLSQQTPTPQRLVEEQLQERPKRHDYVFTWEQEGFRVKDATYRRTIVIQGGTVGRYSEYLYVPERWKRDFARLRSRNELYTRVAQAAAVLLVLAAIAVLIQSFRRGQIRWRPLLLISGTVAGLMAINQWNAIPFAIDGMPTSSPYTQSLIFVILMGLGAGVGVFFYVILAAAAGEPLYRASQPAHVSLLAVPGRRAICTKEFFLATVTGYGFAAAHIAFVVAFYLVGRRFGVWSPQDVNYSDLLSTALPWVYPLTISLLASTSEEFWFRLLAVPLLKRWLRSTWLAVVIPAVVWGFLHANYPQQPPYIRGIEVGVIGVAAGYLMLRFGILATLIWHYAVDAVLIGMFLIRAESAYYQIAGWVVAGAVAFPLLISLGFYRKHRGFLADPALLNSGIVQELSHAPSDSGEAAHAGEPIEPRWSVKWLYGAAVAAVAAGVVFHPVRFGDFIRVKLARVEAEQIAAREFANRVREPGEWRKATEFASNIGTAEFEYLRRIAGAEAANRAVREHTDTAVWRTRFFKPLNKEEWRIAVGQEGRALAVEHVLDEKAPGANRSFEEARQLAEDYLAREKGLAPGRYRIVDFDTEQREKRTDHTFVWEDPAFSIGEAKARFALEIVGEEPSGFRRFFKLPEQWLREFEKPRLTSLLVPGAIVAAGILLLVSFVKRLGARDATGGPSHRYHWRAYLTVAGAAAIAAACSALNRWPQVFVRYDTAEPIEGRVTQALLGSLMTTLLLGVAVFIAALAADVFLQLAAGDRRLRHPSLARAAAVFAVLWGFSRAVAGLGQHVPGPRLSLPLWNLPGAATALPAVEIISSAFLWAVLAVCLATIAVAAAGRCLSARGRWITAGAAGLVYAAGNAQNSAQFVWLFAVALAAAGLVTAIARICAADLLTFGIAIFWLVTAAHAATLIEQPAAFFKWNGAACLLAAASAGVAVSKLSRRHRAGTAGGTG